MDIDGLAAGANVVVGLCEHRGACAHPRAW